MIKALLIDDDLKLAKLLENYLSKFTITLTSISDSLQAMDAIKDQKPEVIILDVMMPGINGFDVCRLIRKKHSVPIIMLSARGEPNDKIKGLELGADDYIIKPFDPSEVVARIRARLRKDKSANTASTTARFEGWIAHFDRYMLENDSGQETPFSHAEGEVLRLFLESPKRLISRAHMQETLGGAAGESFDRAMDVRISRLRTKLNEDPKNPQLIKTIYGAGYIFLGDVRWER